MSIILAFTRLVDLVDPALKSRFADIECEFGWREPVKQQRPTRRVCWIPGDESGSFGKELGALKVPIDVGRGRTARSLADLEEFFHVHLQAHDPECPDDERAQYVYTRLLYDAWRACVYRACHGDKKVGIYHQAQSRWKIDGTTSARRGAALIITFSLRCPVPDSGTAIARPSSAVVTPAEGDLQAADIAITPEPETT